MIGVYQILNTATGDGYIGASVDVERRWSRHKSDLRLQRHKSRRLQDAWNEHGAEKFVLSILQTLTERDNMDAAEQWHIDTLAPAYNVAGPGGGAPDSSRPQRDRGNTTRCPSGLHSLHACTVRGLCKPA